MHHTRPRTTTAAGNLARAVILMMLATLGLVVLGTSPATAANDDVSWAVRTASNDFGRDRQNYSYTLDPSGTLEDGLMVANHGKEPLTLDVYAADGFTTEAGQLDLEPRDKKPTGAGAWIHPEQSKVTIKPGKSVEVPFTVTLPDNATPGDHMGGIITSLTQADEVEGINVDRRLAVRVRLRVGGELKPTLAVEGVGVDYSGTLNPFAKGDATLSYTIHNTGNAILTARQAASVAGPFGSLKVSATKIADSVELLPGDKQKVSVPLHGVAPALLLGGKVTVTPLVTDASGTISPLSAVEGTTHALAIPWTLLLILVLVIVLAVVAVLRRRQAKVREDARVQEAIEQALLEQAGSLQ